MGRVLKGRLVVHTASGQQHSYDVRGRMPAYVPPDPKALRSTIDTGAGGGSGGGRGAQPTQPAQPAPQRVAGQGQERPQGRR